MLQRAAAAGWLPLGPVRANQPDVIESGLVQVHIACAERGRVMQVVWENFISVHKYIVTSQQESVALKHHAELKAVRDELTRLKMAHAELQELHTTQVRPACCMPVCFSAAVLLFVLRDKL
jgi:hypothetical protein